MIDYEDTEVADIRCDLCGHGPAHPSNFEYREAMIGAYSICGKCDDDYPLGIGPRVALDLKMLDKRLEKIEALAALRAVHSDSNTLIE